MNTRLFLILWLFVAMVFAGDPLPNFTGKWILDAKQSQMGQAPGPGRGM